MSWGFPPEIEKTLIISEDPDILSEKVLSVVKQFDWNMELKKDNYLYFTRKQKYRLHLFFLKNERTDIIVRINENNISNLLSALDK